MQLKKDENELVNNVESDAGDNVVSQENETTSGEVTNNDYLKPQDDFLVGDGIFGEYQGLYGTGGSHSDVNDSVVGEESRPRKLTKKEFFQSPRNRKDRDRIIISTVVIIVAALFDVIRTDFWLSALKKQIEFANSLAETMGIEEYVIDTQKIMNTQIIMSVILIGLAIGILVAKSRACALIGLAITFINCISTLISTHSFRWYWTMIAFGYATLATFSFAKAWQNYEENGDWKKDW